MAEYIAVPATNLIPLADTVSTEIGLLAEPVGVVLHGWHRLETYNLSPQRVVFLGAGSSAARFARTEDHVPMLAALSTAPASAHFQWR